MLHHVAVYEADPEHPTSTSRSLPHCMLQCMTHEAEVEHPTRDCGRSPSRLLDCGADQSLTPKAG